MEFCNNSPHAIPCENLNELLSLPIATLRYYCKDGSRVIVNYERAACTHGKEQSNVQIEGTKGAVAWDWLCYSGEGKLIKMYDEKGIVQEKCIDLEAENKVLGFIDKPLFYFNQLVKGESTYVIVNSKALGNFNLLQAIYKNIENEERQVKNFD